MKVKTICENRLLCYLGAVNAPLGTTLSILPIQFFSMGKPGSL